MRFDELKWSKIGGDEYSQILKYENGYTTRVYMIGGSEPPYRMYRYGEYLRLDVIELACWLTQLTPLPLKGKKT